MATTEAPAPKQNPIIEAFQEETQALDFAQKLDPKPGQEALSERALQKIYEAYTAASADQQAEAQKWLQSKCSPKKFCSSVLQFRDAEDAVNKLRQSAPPLTGEQVGFHSNIDLPIFRINAEKLMQYAMEKVQVLNYEPAIEMALERGVSPPKGKVEIEITIPAEGGFPSQVVKTDKFNGLDSRISGALITELRHTSFPDPPNGEEVVLRRTFNFEPFKTEPETPH